MLSYKDLRSALLFEEQQGNVFRKTDGPHPAFELWCYVPDLTVRNEWNEINSLARGLVLDTMAERIFWVMPKFFNFGQNGIGLDTLPKEWFYVENKWDGSMVVAWYDPYNKTWRCSTKGSFNSEQAQWAEAYLKKHGPSGDLDPGMTYIFEAIYPENRIVIDYKGKSSMVPLTCFDCDGVEDDIIPGMFDPEYFWPNKYLPYYNIQELLDMAKKESYNVEGWIIKFASGLRVKIKTADYLRVHRLIAGITEKRVYEILIAGIDPVTAAAGLPDEFHQEFMRLVTNFLGRAQDVYNHVIDWLSIATEGGDFASRKELALAVQEQLPDKLHQSVAFNIYDDMKKEHVMRNILRGIQKSTIKE